MIKQCLKSDETHFKELEIPQKCIYLRPQPRYLALPAAATAAPYTSHSDLSLLLAAGGSHNQRQARGCQQPLGCEARGSSCWCGGFLQLCSGRKTPSSCIQMSSDPVHAIKQ